MQTSANFVRGEFYENLPNADVTTKRARYFISIM